MWPQAQPSPQFLQILQLELQPQLLFRLQRLELQLLIKLLVMLLQRVQQLSLPVLLLQLVLDQRLA